jgi:hypothetical protein
MKKTVSLSRANTSKSLIGSGRPPSPSKIRSLCGLVGTEPSFNTGPVGKAITPRTGRTFTPNTYEACRKQALIPRVGTTDLFQSGTWLTQWNRHGRNAAKPGGIANTSPVSERGSFIPMHQYSRPWRSLKRWLSHPRINNSCLRWLGPLKTS